MQRREDQKALVLFACPRCPPKVAWREQGHIELCSSTALGPTAVPEALTGAVQGNKVRQILSSFLAR